MANAHEGVPTSSPEWLTVREYAELIRVTPRTVTRWVKADPDMRVQRMGPAGRTIRIHRSEVDRQISALPAA